MTATQAPCPVEEKFLRSKGVLSTISERSVTTTRANSDDSESWRTDSDVELDTPSSGSKCQSEASPQQRRRKAGNSGDIMKLFQTGAEALLRAKALNSGASLPARPKEAAQKRQPKKPLLQPGGAGHEAAGEAPVTSRAEETAVSPKLAPHSKDQVAQAGAANSSCKFRCDAVPFVPNAKVGSGVSAIRDVAQGLFGDTMVSFTDSAMELSTAIYITLCSATTQADAAHSLRVALSTDGSFRVRSPLSDCVWINVEYMSAAVATQCPEFIKHGWCTQPGCTFEHRRPEAFSVAVSVVGAQSAYNTQPMCLPLPYNMVPMQAQQEAALQWVPVPVPVPALPPQAVFASAIPVQMPIPMFGCGSWGAQSSEPTPTHSSTQKPILSLAPLCQEPTLAGHAVHQSVQHHAAVQSPTAAWQGAAVELSELAPAMVAPASVTRNAPAVPASCDRSEQPATPTGSTTPTAEAASANVAALPTLLGRARPAPEEKAVKRGARWADLEDEDDD